MSDTIAKSVEKSGTKMTKEKLLEAIRKSPQKVFSFSQSPSSQVVTVVVTLWVRIVVLHQFHCDFSLDVGESGFQQLAA